MIRLQAVPFDYGAECAAFAAAQAGAGAGAAGTGAAGTGAAGAVVTFLGLVRDESGRLSGMEIEHYPGMTEAAIARIEAEARARWQLSASLVIHRHGRLAPGEAIMMVATAARHRGAAFAAAEFLMDYLKSRAPFWKKEFSAGGDAEWVAAKDEDEAALGRWSR